MKKIIIILITGVILTISCTQKTKGQDITLKLVALTSVGNVRSGEKKIKIGDVLKTGDTIITGKRSFIELQMLGKQGTVVMRVQPSTRFLIKSRKISSGINHTTHLKTGSMQFQVNKTASDETFSVATPTAIAAVRGTAFSVSTTKNGKSKIQVIEGRVAVRPSLGKLEELPDEIREQSKVVSKVLLDADQNSVVLESGKESSLDRTTQKTYLKKNNLETIVNSKIVTDTLNMDSKNIKQAIQSIDKKLEKESIQIVDTKSIILKEIPAKELKKKKKEIQDLKPLPVEAISNSVAKPDELKKILTQRNSENKVVIRKRIERLYHKPFEKLELKNGQKVFGVVSQKGNMYIVVTPDGVLQFHESKVLGIAF